MSGSVQFQANDWAVFLDGVQIPFQYISIGSGENEVSSGTVVVEPDVLVERIRPKAVIAIFCRDRYDGRTFDTRIQELQDGFLYFGGGEVTGVSYGKQPHSRSMQIEFAGDLQILESHQGFISGIGGNPFYGQVVGTTLLNPFEFAGTGSPRDLLSFTVLAGAFDRSGDAGPPDFGRHRSLGDENEDFGLRVLRLLSWLSSHNGSMRMQCVRTRLMNKIAAVEDQTLHVLAKQSIAVPVFSQTNTRVGSEDSMLDIVRKIQSRVGYRFVTSFLPHFPGPDGQPPSGNPDLVPVPPPLEEQYDDLFRFRREWYRNDYLWIPNLFYSAPPPCNFIFPDMLGSKQTARSFMAEPTRSIFVDSALPRGARLVFVEATGLLSGEINRLQTPDQFWGNFTHLLDTSTDVEPPSDSAWHSHRDKRTGVQVSILDQVADEELEKGIVLDWKQLDQEYMLALARNLNLKELDGSHNEEEYDRLRRIIGSVEAGSEDEEDIRRRAYMTYVQQWLKYKHQLARWRRPSQIVLKGHRWLAPGFSAVIFDSDVSYLTYVKGVRHEVSADGTENTTVTIDHTRPITTIDAATVTEVESTTNDTTAVIRQAQNAIAETFDSDTAAFEDRLTQLEEDHGAVVAARDAHANAEGQAALQAEILARAQPSIRRFEENYALIVGRARAYADVVVGPRKNLAGALTARRNEGLGDALLDLLDPAGDPDSPGSFEAVDDALSRAQRAMRSIETFNESQVQQASAGQPSHGELPIQAEKLREAGLLLAEEADKLEALIARLDTQLDFPVPPPFYNEDFISLATLDAQYRDLLGCQPFYTGEYSRGITYEELPSDFVGPLSENQARAGAYLEHLKMVRMFARVFPAVNRTAIDPQSTSVGVDNGKLETSPSSWDDVVSSVAEDQGTMRWQHERFLRRKAQTLQEYLVTHGFAPALETLISDEPSPTIFFRMRPIPSPDQPQGVTSEETGKTYGWDDSVVCRIVDENTRTGEIAERGLVQGELISAANDAISQATAGRDVVSPPEIVETPDGPAVQVVISDPAAPGGQRTLLEPIETTTTAPRDADPLVRARRERAAGSGSVFLTSEFRQDQVIAYSRRHMGSRAFSGE